MTAFVGKIPAPNVGTSLGRPPGFDKVSAIGTGYPNDASGFNLSGRIFASAGPVTLTKSSATSIVDIAVPSNTVVAGELFYSIYATDGTEYQVLAGHIPFTAVNKAGALTSNLGTAVENTAVSAGTLTNTVTNVTGTNKITLKLNAVPSITPTTHQAQYTLVMNGNSGSVLPL